MLDSLMLAHDFKRSQYNSYVYIKVVNGSPIYLLLYIDDMLIAAKSKKQIAPLTKFFIVLICLMQRNLVHLLHHTLNCPLHNILVLSPSQNVRRLSLVKSQRLLSLIKFTQKNMNIYNTKFISIDSP
jgi:hypothetical protein